MTVRTAGTVVAMPWGTVELRSLGDGEPVLVLHRDLGPIGWDALLDRLAAQHTVHALSLPGFGGSTLPEWARRVDHLAVLVGRVIDHVGLGPVPVVGLGFGGWVAAELLATSPSRVAGLAVVSPMGLKPDAGEIVDQFLYSARDYATLSLGAGERLDALTEGMATDDVDEQLDRAREAVTRVAWKPIGHDRALPGLLAGLRVPAAVVWGTSDAVVPASTAEQWAELLGAPSPSLVDGAPHHVEVVEPDAVARALLTWSSTC